MTQRRFIIIISLSVCIMKFGSNKDPRVWSVVLPSIFNIIIKLFTCMAGQHDDGTRGWPEVFFWREKIMKVQPFFDEEEKEVWNGQQQQRPRARRTSSFFAAKRVF